MAPNAVERAQKFAPLRAALCVIAQSVELFPSRDG
jgi:hypothetical protein